MNVLRLISQLIGIETLRLTVSTRDEKAISLNCFETVFSCKIVLKILLNKKNLCFQCNF